MAEIIDTLVTQLEFEANTEVLDKAEKKQKELEAQLKQTAKEVDALSVKQIKLREKLAATAEKTDKLKDEKAKLTAEIRKQKGPTDEQRQRLAKLDTQLNETTKETREYRRELTKLGVEQGKLKRTQGALSQQHGKLSTAVTGVKKTMADTSGTVAGQLTSWVAGFAGVQVAIQAASRAAELLVGLGRTVIETGAKFESLRARLKTVTGSVGAANEAFAMIKDFARTTPFELEDVTTAFVRLKSLGLNPSTDALRAYGNIAAAQGKPIMDFVEAVADAATGEFERLKEFGIKASSQGKEVAFTFGGVTTKVGKNAREITAFLEQLGETQFAGAMEDQMATFSGAMSNAQDTWSQFMDNVAQQGPLDTAKEGLGVLSSVLTDELAETLAELIDGVLTKLIEIFEDLTTGSVNLGDSAKGMGEILGMLGRILEPLIAAFGLLVKGAMAAVQVFGKVAEIWNKLFDIISDTLRPLERLSDLWGSLKEKIGLAGQQSEMWFEKEASMSEKLIGIYHDLARARGQVVSVTEMTTAELQKHIQEGTATPEMIKEQENRIAANLAEEKRQEAISAAEDRKEKEAKKVKDASKNMKDWSTERVRKFSTDPNVPEKTREKAEEELRRRERKSRKAGQKAADAERKKTVAAQIEKQLETNARQIAQSRAARALQTGEITPGELAGFETAEYKKILEVTTHRFQTTGELPAGIEMGLRQVAALPNQAPIAGMVAPPVVSITNIRYDVHDNEFTAVAEGQFAQTPQEFTDMSLSLLRQGVQKIFGEATPTPEKR